MNECFHLPLGVVGGQGPLAFRHMAGFESSGPLAGAAVFDVILPDNVVGIYVGVRDWCDLSRRRQAYCRIDNIFLENAMASFGLADLPPQPHASRRPIRMQPNRVHRFSLRWHARLFQIMLDGQHIATARAREGAPPAPSALSKPFVWAFARPTPNLLNMVQFRPIRSPVEMTATIKCAICNRESGLLMPRWCICPLCSTWVCAAHVGQQPTGFCPRCPNQLLDYVGGSWRADEPYPTAMDFFSSKHDFVQDEMDKNVAVVVKVMREHLDFLRTSPLAVAFLPDPRYRNSISKRLWERIMYRARAIIDFLDQKQHSHFCTQRPNI